MMGCEVRTGVFAGFPSVRAVLLDAAGTVIYPDPPVAEAYYLLGRQHGSRLTARQIAQRFPAAFARSQAGQLPGARSAAADRSGKDADPYQRPPTDHDAQRQQWKRIVADVFHDVPHADGPLFAALWDHFDCSRHWRLFADVPRVWAALEARGLVVGLASNFDDRLASICRGHAPLDRCRRLFWSARIGHSKPSPQFFEEVKRRLQLEPSEILLVGDDLVNDYQGARAAGWYALLLRREGPAGAGESPAEPAQVIHHLDSVLPLLERNTAE
jgi:putative hydrolase of the HAD superfamily